MTWWSKDLEIYILRDAESREIFIDKEIYDVYIYISINIQALPVGLWYSDGTAIDQMVFP